MELPEGADMKASKRGYIPSWRLFISNLDRPLLS